MISTFMKIWSQINLGKIIIIILIPAQKFRSFRWELNDLMENIWIKQFRTAAIIIYTKKQSYYFSRFSNPLFVEMRMLISFDRNKLIWRQNQNVHEVYDFWHR